MKQIGVREGAGALLRGIVPRIGLGVWQTLFMVSGSKLLQDALVEAAAE